MSFADGVVVRAGRCRRRGSGRRCFAIEVSRELAAMLTR